MFKAKMGQTFQQAQDGVGTRLKRPPTIIVMLSGQGHERSRGVGHPAGQLRRDCHTLISSGFAMTELALSRPLDYLNRVMRSRLRWASHENDSHPELVEG